MASAFGKLGNDLYTGARSVDFVGKRKIWYLISIIAIIFAVVGPIARGGFSFGIEFTGGSQFQIHLTQQQERDVTIAEGVAQDVMTGSVPRISTLGQSNIRVQTEQLDDAQAREISALLAEAYDVEPSEVTSSYIGATWGQDITRSAIQALVVFILFA